MKRVVGGGEEGMGRRSKLIFTGLLNFMRLIHNFLSCGFFQLQAKHFSTAVTAGSLKVAANNSPPSRFD